MRPPAVRQSPQFRPSHPVGHLKESIVKRFHVHVGVKDLEESIRFYSGLFGAEPSIRKPDYAKWMIDDPRINFAISQRSTRFGVNHLGLQVDEAAELPVIKQRFEAADPSAVVDEIGVSCCYARSDKHWVTDPQGIAWEGWHNLGQVELYDGEARVTASQGNCCAPGSNEGVPAVVKRQCCAPAPATEANAPAPAGCCA
jgi:catechol 2,3-dioxygenase-like lactoylglutathione lyase family enzyme